MSHHYPNRKNGSPPHSGSPHGGSNEKEPEREKPVVSDVPTVVRMGDKIFKLVKAGRLWQSKDENAIGVTFEGWMDFMTGKKYKDKPELDSEYFWYALLAVPKGDRDREPSINKYSPLVARAVSYSSVMQQLKKWYDENGQKSTWELRED